MNERAALTKTSENKGKDSVAAKPKENFYESMDSPIEQIFHLQRTMGNQAVQRLLKSGTIQAKLKIGKPNDKYEQEADRVADKVMRMPETKRSLVNGHWSLGKRQKESSLAQRKSGCPECPEKEGIQTKPLADQITPLVQRQAGPDEEEEPVQTKQIQRQEAEEEEEPVQTKLQRQPEDEEEEPIQAKQANNQTPAVTSHIESSINSLKGGGQPLSESTRSYFEPRFGADFSQVRIHNDSQAAETAKSINSKAFTTSKDVGFATGQYSPGTSTGKRLLAHELTHVVQQRSNILSRRKAEPRAQVGPVSGMGGLIYDTYRKRLSVIIGPNDALRSIAKKLLPIWNSAKPFKLTSTSAPVPFTPLTVEQLAKGLLVYNRYYLAVPFMTKWKVGLRFPLPIRINKLTGERILHPGLIATWAKSFDSKWDSLLDRKPVSTKMPSSAELQKSVTKFLKAWPTLSGRGIALSAKAMTNSLEAEPFIKEVFKRVGKDAFAVALEFMNWLVNHQLQLLASQCPGFDIILEVRKILSKPPANLGSEQKKNLARAQLMLSKIGVFTAQKAASFKQIYIKKAYDTNCMIAVYKGLEALFSPEVSKSIESQVIREATAYKRRTRINTNHMNRIMETVRARGKAGPVIVLKYRGRRRGWHPKPEQTVLSMTHPNVAGWYFFGFSLHGAYHSVILAVDKTNLANPQIYWMDQFTKGFTSNVTGKLEKEMKRYKPSYGFAATKLWQIIPAADTLIELY